MARANGFASDDEFTGGTRVGDLSLRRQFSRDAMMYLTAARGYKPGAYNTGAGLSSGIALPPMEKSALTIMNLGPNCPRLSAH